MNGNGKAAEAGLVGPRSSRPTTQSPICVRVTCAMSILGIGKTKLYELLAEGELEAIRVGRRRLILQESIDALVERLRAAAVRPQQPCR